MPLYRRAVPAWRPAFIPLGEVGSWDRFNHSIANNSPVVVGDELRFYYSGRTYRHAPYRGKDTGPSRAGIGFASIERDRFVALQASFDGGEILTKPLKIAGKTLHLNARSDFGEILVQALGIDGSIIAESQPIQMDALDTSVEWKETWTPAANTPVKLRISLRNACLFAIWAE